MWRVGDKLLSYLALWDASSDSQHQITATITISPMKGTERTGCSDGWVKLCEEGEKQNTDETNTETMEMEGVNM